jgi:DNA polymerase-4
MRKIIHIDMDAFYASVEQRDEPSYRNKPVIVGGSPQGRGVVAAASYEARKYGIRSAMPAIRAIKKCPHAIFVKPRFDVYKEVSQQIRAIFDEYTDLVEPLSLDEAYLDVTHPFTGPPSATLIAKEIKHKIRTRLDLVASAGVSYNKFLAKIASDLDKPDGLSIILPEEAEAFLRSLPIGKFYGVGHATQQKMEKLGIRTGEDLLQWSESDLAAAFGKAGHHYYYLVRGIDDREVKPHRIRKSVGKERTFAEDVTDMDWIRTFLTELAGKVAESLQRVGGGGQVGDEDVGRQVMGGDGVDVGGHHMSGERVDAGNRVGGGGQVDAGDRLGAGGQVDGVGQKSAGERANTIERLKAAGRTITLKVRYDDFETVTRSLTLMDYTNNAKDIAETAVALLKETQAGVRPVRLLGISVSSLNLEKSGRFGKQIEIPFH